MRNGVGSTGSAPPVNMTSAACVSPQLAIGRIVRSASSGVVMIWQPEPVEPPVIVQGAATHIHPAFDPEPTSTPMRDEAADLVRRCKNDVGAVAHHPRPD